MVQTSTGGEQVRPADAPSLNRGIARAVAKYSTLKDPNVMDPTDSGPQGRRHPSCCENRRAPRVCREEGHAEPSSIVAGFDCGRE